MADFRKSFLLAAMALAVGVGTASAQTPSCVGTTGAPPLLRSQGIEELTGQIVITCTNLTPGLTFNITEFLQSGVVTSRVGEPFAVVAPTPQSTAGVVTVGTATAGQITFNGLTNTAATATITIGGIRVDVHGLTAASVLPISAELAVSNGSLPLQSNLYTVGLVENGILASTTTSAIGVSACSATPSTITLGTGVTTLSITEGFATAFKVQNPASNGSPDSETGPYTINGVTYLKPNVTIDTPNGAALPASSGTLLSLTFAGIVSGDTFYIPVTIASGLGGTAQLVIPPSDGSGTFTFVTGSPVIGLTSGVNYISVTNGQPVYYEILTANPSATETYPVLIYPSGPASGTPTVTVGLAPTGTTPAQAVPDSEFVPLFTPNGITSTSLLPGSNITSCQTSLLFPYVTNQVGFDTGFSIAFTGVDPFGTSTSTQGGLPAACTLWFYNGSTTLPPSATLSVPPGGEGHNMISNVAPGFQGYMIAVCNFQLAHGYAFISNGLGGATGIAEGYLPLVLTNDGLRGGTGKGQSLPSTGVTPDLGAAQPENLNN